MGRWGDRGRIAALAASVAALALPVSGCAGRDAPQAPVRARPSTVERLAAAAGCAPAIETDTSGLREGTCLTGRGSYVMATFHSTSAMRAWLAESQAYGGSYLVGERWVVAGPPVALRPVQQRMGGELQADARHGG